LFLEQLAHQFHRCSFIALPLHQQVENLAFGVNRAPQSEPAARDRHRHLIEMPTRCWPRTSTPKFSGEQRPECQYPSPHRFVGDIQSALREQIFDVAITECETQIQPNGVPDDRRRELVAGKRDRRATILPVNRVRAIIRVTRPHHLLTLERPARLSPGPLRESPLSARDRPRRGRPR
jgi:hypothetical protein